MTATGAGAAPHPLAERARQFLGIIAGWIAALGRPARIALSAMPFIIERQRLRVGAIAVVMLVIVAMVWLDAVTIGAVARLPNWINETYNDLTDYGRSTWFLWPSGLLVLLMAAAYTRAATRMSQLVLTAIAVRSGFVFLAIGIPGLIDTISKRWIGRVRPSQFGPFAYHPLSWNSAYASLPSGHATTAFAAAIAVGALWPRARTVIWIYAALIAISRVVIYAHHPSDVLAGAMVGGVGALLVRQSFAARGLAFGVTPQGAIAAFPGPSKRRIKSVARALLAE